MSSVVTAPRRAAPPGRVTAWLRARGGGLGADFALGLCLAAGLVLVAFVAGGGGSQDSELGQNTWVQIALTVLGAGAAVAVVLTGSGRRRWGGATVALFAALAALTYASIAWSVQPANSWLEANRTLSYLAAFAAAVALARLAPGRSRAIAGAVATAATVISAYAVLVKVFPATLDPVDPLGRLRAPFQYWNAVGLMAAMGIPACLWAGSRRERAPVLRALSVPSIAILVPALLLSYSRGALLVAVIGTGCWFVLVPLRLRGALILALGGAAGGAISAWALSDHSITADGVALAQRTSAGHVLGLISIVALVLATAAGFVAAFTMDWVTLAARTRRRVGIALLALVALVPIGGVAALAASSRGLTGEVSHIWTTLTSTQGFVGDQPGRLVDLSNSRPLYWHEGLQVGEHHLLAGAGALGFATANSQTAAGAAYGSAQHAHVEHAHSYAIETFADFGLIGVALNLALLAAWALAAWRTVGRSPPDRQSGGEWIAALTLLAVVVTFGLSSLIDWTWFVPGTAVTALLCAGWLAGRGPIGQAPEGAPGPRRPRSPGAVLLVASIAAVSVLAIWVIVQPLRSSDAEAAAVNAAAAGHTGAALTSAREAASDDPVSVDPLLLLSELYTGIGNGAAARHELVKATSLQPANPVTWLQLGCYDLGRHQGTAAASEFQRALVLEPGNTQLRSDPAAVCST